MEMALIRLEHRPSPDKAADRRDDGVDQGQPHGNDGNQEGPLSIISITASKEVSEDGSKFSLPPTCL